MELRLIHQAEVAIALAGPLLTSETRDYETGIHQLQIALRQLDVFLACNEGAEQSHVSPLHEELEVRRASSVTDGLRALVDRIDEARGEKTSVVNTARIVTDLGEIFRGLDHLARIGDTAATNSREAADVRVRSTIILAAVLCLVIILITVLISIWQYRGMVRPLRVLREGVRRISSGRLSEQIAVTGDGEFAELTDEFNRMATEVDDLYRNLESKVVTKSKQLVRSERLASVGFLAAGVAHEINTPLNIVSAYAELTLNRLFSADEEVRGDAETHTALQIIRDESFRCKEIIEELLSLSRPGEQSRNRVSLAHIADEVVSMVSHLKIYQGRQVTLQLDELEALLVVGSAAELKQVLLNLMVNALEAVEPDTGKVFIDGRCRDGWAELCVTDNGRGMTPETLEHVFEPFFTTRRESSACGAGLGLSITHAIIEAHGGRITAESDGPGLGTRFIVQLPAVAEKGSHERITSQVDERSTSAGC